MNDQPVKGPPEEQQICVTCGFCCDGTLFWHASLQPGEKGSLPEKIEQNYQKSPDSEWFTLPCLYFSGKCTIYDQKRADVCSTYRCQLLMDFADEKVRMEEALEIVRNALIMRKEIMDEYRRLSGKEHDPTFRELLADMGAIQKSLSGTDLKSFQYDLLLARCNIFESLLIKHFRSVSDFNDMMADEGERE